MYCDFIKTKVLTLLCTATFPLLTATWYYFFPVYFHQKNYWLAKVLVINAQTGISSTCYPWLNAVGESVLQYYGAPSPFLQLLSGSQDNKTYLGYIPGGWEWTFKVYIAKVLSCIIVHLMFHCSKKSIFLPQNSTTPTLYVKQYYRM